METTGGYASWPDCTNERNIRSIHNIIREGLLDINNHENKWCCAAEKSSVFHIRRIHNVLDNISPQFTQYSKNPNIHTLREFGCDKYPITSSTKNLDDRTQEELFMGYTNSRSTMTWWDPQKMILKYCLSAWFDERNNKLGKVWSPGSELMLGTNIFALPTFIIDPSDHLFIKYDIFEGNVNFPPRGTPSSIVTQYCEHHNMSYISQ